MDEAEVGIPIPRYPAYNRCSSARFCRTLRWECQKDGVAICNATPQEGGRKCA